MFAPVTEDAIEEFGVSYRGSDEERAELLQYYMRFEGNMDKVFQWVMLSEPETDSHRFMDIIDAAIKAKHATRYKQYTTWAKEVSGRPRPNPAAVSKKRQRAEGGKGKGKGKKGEASGSGRDEAALVAMMKKRREGAFTGMLEGLAAKYGCDGALEAEPTDEEFEAARRRMEAHKASAGKSKKNSKK